MFRIWHAWDERTAAEIYVQILPASLCAVVVA